MSGSIISDGTPAGPEVISGPASSESASQSNSVRGERNAPSVNGARSLQSRISSVFAAGLMIALGVGGLSWYYASALSRQSHARQAAVSAAANSAQGEMVLPPLGGVAAPRAPAVPESDTASSGNSEFAVYGRGVVGTLPASVANPTLPLDPNRAMDLTRATYTSGQNWGGATSSLPTYTGAGSYSQPQRTVPEDRRLSGAAFTRDSGQSGSTSSGDLGGASASVGLPTGGAAVIEAARGLGLSNSTNRTEDSLTTLLRPGVVTSARAQTLPTQQFLLPKGAFIDCTLETALDSTLPGMTTCVTATDTFGVDGKVVLLERGSKLIGETRGEVQNGSARVFVLWTEARTPTGVLVPLDSPGTDELGRSGLPGEVNRHFWDRFGAAILVSVIDGATQAAAQSTNRGGGAVIYNPSTSQDALTDVLKGTINIAPTVTKQQGDRIQILVARDLDFRTVYELRTTGN